jgi:hypothetical protein
MQKDRGLGHEGPALWIARRSQAEGVPAQIGGPAPDLTSAGRERPPAMY